MDTGAVVNSTSSAPAGGAGILTDGYRPIWVCEHITRFPRSKGIFFGDNPLVYTTSVLVLQSSLVGWLTTCLQILLHPLGESSFFSQMLAGLIMGPSILGQIESVSKLLFPPRSFYVSETIAFFGSMMFMFLIGVKIDLSAVMRTGRKTWAIGLCSFAMPILLSTLAAFILRPMLLSPEQNIYHSIPYIAFFLSSCSFHVTVSHLADLKLLNSEIGSLAVSSSMVSGTVSALWVTSLFQRYRRVKKEDNHKFNMLGLCIAFLVALIIFVFRPIMQWMIRNTPEGRPIKQSYIFSIFFMLLGCALFSECVGEHFMIGPVVLGIVVPDGPPLGSALSEKLDPLVNVVFLPLYYLFSGARFKLSLIDARSFVIVQLVAICSFCGKIIGAMLPSLYNNMSVTDALSLGLLMSAQGITQMLYLQGSLLFQLIDEQSYSNVVIAMLWLTGGTTPFVKLLYDPSKRYLSVNKRRTIEHASQDVELPLMACLHCSENTPSIINILEMSNPTEQNPICFNVLHLIQLTGRSTPLFIDHQHGNKTSSMYSSNSQHIINAFRSYEQQNKGKVVVKLFTSMSPYETIHDEVCLQAAEKRASMLIVPFHRQWSPSGITESAHPIRAMNRHLLRTAPCSVGILVERGTLSRYNPLTCVSFYSVGVIFIEGSDDREALVYAMRMADHPNVSVTMIRLMEPRRKSRNLMQRDPDGDLIHKFKVDCIQIKRHDYREEVVRDGVELINVIRSLDGCFDLILVGRRHASENSLFGGLSEWNEYPELGVVGDMLVSSDSSYEGSVLVVQQQRLGVGHHDFHLDAPAINAKQEPLTIVEVPRDKKVWPMV